MRVTNQPAQRRRLAFIERVVVILGFMALLKGIFLLQSNKREIKAASNQWVVVLRDDHWVGGGGVGSGTTSTNATKSANSTWKQPQDAHCRLGVHRRDFSAKELELQEERYAAWQAGRARGLAMCLVIKDQAEDLSEWVEYHLRLGAEHIYIYDTGSRPPVKWALQPFRQAGTVTYRYITDFVEAAQELNTTNNHKYSPKYKQWIVYSMCLRDHGKRHHFMAFIDSDEYFVIMDGTPDLPTLLADYEQYGGLVANWRILGSSGHKTHQDSTLLAYTKCYPEELPEQLAIKSIVNTALAVQPASPHNAFYVGGCYAVSTAEERVDGSASKRIRSERLVVHHYVTKSLQDFQEKMERGGGLGVNFRDMDYWKKVQAQSTETCSAAVNAWRRMHGGTPQRQQLRRQRRPRLGKEVVILPE